MHGDKLNNNLLNQEEILNLEVKKDKEVAIETQILTQNPTVDSRECVKPVKKVFFIDKFTIFHLYFITQCGLSLSCE